MVISREHCLKPTPRIQQVSLQSTLLKNSMSSDESAQNLTFLYGELVVLLNQEARWRNQVQRKQAKEKIAATPHRAFSEWLQTDPGKLWMAKQHEYQKGLCPVCNASLQLDDAVIHHVLPLKDFGSSANKPENLKLLHPDCNLPIGSKISH